MSQDKNLNITPERTAAEEKALQAIRMANAIINASQVVTEAALPDEELTEEQLQQRKEFKHTQKQIMTKLERFAEKTKPYKPKGFKSGGIAINSGAILDPDEHVINRKK